MKCFVCAKAHHLRSSTSVVIGLYNWQGSEASETVLGVDNAKSGIYSMYVYIYVWIVRMPLNNDKY